MGLIDSLKQAVLKEITETLIPQVDVVKMYGEEWKDMDQELKDELSGLEEQANEAFTGQRDELMKGLEVKWTALNSALTLTVNSCLQLGTRLALVPAAIISTTPVGPGVAVNAIPQAIAQLKNDGEVAGKAYDDTKNALSDLVGSVSGGMVGTLKDTVLGLLGTAATLLAVVGISKDGVPAENPKVESPIEVPEYKASECANFDPINPETQPGTDIIKDISCENCKNYEALVADSERSCNNCKNYKKSE